MAREAAVSSGAAIAVAPDVLESAGATGIDYCNHCGKRVCADGRIHASPSTKGRRPWVRDPLVRAPARVDEQH
jgi:hypothetical protein